MSVNLPNPSMSFSPFAILTAEEMNNIIENINSLADGTGFDAGAIGKADIASAAVDQSKIDFTNFIKVYSVANQSAVPATGGTGAVIATIDITSYPIGAEFLCTFSTTKFGAAGTFVGIYVTYNSISYVALDENRGTTSAAVNAALVVPITKVSGQNSIVISLRADVTTAIPMLGSIIRIA